MIYFTDTFDLLKRHLNNNLFQIIYKFHKGITLHKTSSYPKGNLNNNLFQIIYKSHK